MFDKLSNAELLSIYNAHAPKPAVRFESRKIGESRTFKVLQSKGLTIEDVVAPAADDEPAVTESDAYFNKVEAMTAIAERSAAVAAECIARKMEANDMAKKPAAAKAEAALMAPDAIGDTVKRMAAEVIAKTTPKAKPAANKAIEAKIEEAGFSGKRLALFRLMLRKDGVSEAEGCSELAWAQCSATMFRVYKSAEAVGFTMRKWKGAEGKMRYGAAV